MFRKTIGKKVTIKDLASALSLSTCTVSRILNGNLENVKYRPETIRRVKKLAEKHAYRPHTVAKSLVSGKTHTIGLCVADIGNPVYAELAKEFENVASEFGYATFTCSIEEDLQRQSDYVDMLLDRHVDVLVISPVDESSVKGLLAKTRSQGTKLVIFDRASANVGTHAVVVDNEESMCALTEHCLQLGHRRIGVITGNPADISLKLRLSGMKNAVRLSGMTKRNVLKIAKGGQTTTTDSGMRAVLELLALREPPTVVISLANVLSIGAIRGIQRNHLRIGKDISFAAFDDFPCADLMTPPITVIRQPIHEIARACARLACQEAETSAHEELFRTTLCWRASIVAPVR